MTAGVQDAAEVLRGVQKLSKEIAPVKNALAALYKREEANANAEAAAASLEKIAARVDKVLATYRPIIEAADDLTTRDLPVFLHQASLLLTDDATVDAHVELARAQKEQRAQDCTSRPARQRRQDRRRGRETPISEAVTRVASGADEPNRQPTMFDDVCPLKMPFILQPEDYRYFRQQLQLRVDMVNYLLLTGRKAFALHVAESYHLPLLWFPELHDDRVRALQAAREKSGSRGHTLMDTIRLTASASPYAAASGAGTSLRATSASPMRCAGTPGKPPVSPMLLAAEVPNVEASPSVGTPPRLESPATCEERPVVSSAVFTPPCRRVPLRALYGTSTRGHSDANGVRGSDQTALSSPISSATAGAAAQSHDTYARASCNLILRVLASAVYMKDEYMDRMIVESLIAERQYVETVEAANAATEPSRNQSHTGRTPSSEGRPHASPRSPSTPDASSPSSIPQNAPLASPEQEEAPPSPAPTSPSRLSVAPVSSSDRFLGIPQARASGSSSVAASAPRGTGAPDAAEPHANAPPLTVRTPRTTANAASPWSSSRPPLVAPEPVQSSRFAVELTRDAARSCWRAAHHDRAASLPVSTLNTQSGSLAFDKTMMAIIEDVLEGIVASEEEDGGPRLRMPNVVNAAAQPVARQSKRRPLLSPEGLRVADETFTQEKLAIKRATRLFDGHSGAVIGGDPGEDTLVGGVNMSSSCIKRPERWSQPVNPRDYHVLATPDGSVWTGAGIRTEVMVPNTGLTQRSDEEADETQPPAVAAPITSGVPSGDGSVLYDISVLRRIFIS